jgi:hypothetical protein
MKYLFEAYSGMQGTVMEDARVTLSEIACPGSPSAPSGLPGQILVFLVHIKYDERAIR